MANVRVGKGMRGTEGIGGKVHMTIGDAGVNVEAIWQSTSQHYIMYGIQDRHSRMAVKAVYDKFIR